MTKTFDDYEDASRAIVQSLHIGGDVLAVGHVHPSGDDIRPIAGNTVVIDLGGQGQDVRVYEVIFYADGSGVYLCVASTYQEGASMPEDLKFNLVDGKVEITSPEINSV